MKYPIYVNDRDQKRDQRSFDLVQRYLPSLILATVVRIVNGMDEPYTLNPGVGGKNGYLPRTMAIVCIMLEAERRTYRKMAGYLHADREAARKMGLTGNIPSKSTICNSYSLIPESYLREVHARVIEGLQGSGSIAGDSTGYSVSRFEKWVDFRTDRIRNRHGWIKNARHHRRGNQGRTDVSGDCKPHGRHKGTI